MDKTRQERYNMIYGNTARKIEASTQPASTQPDPSTACDADPYGVSGTSDDAMTWRFGPTQPDCLLLTALVYGESEWLALDLLSVGEAAEIRAHRSDDLVTWTPVGQPLLGATSILHASPLPD